MPFFNNPNEIAAKAARDRQAQLDRDNAARIQKQNQKIAQDAAQNAAKQAQDSTKATIERNRKSFWETLIKPKRAKIAKTKFFD